MNKSYQIGLWILISVVPFLIFIQMLYGTVFMLLFGCLTILTMGIFYDLKRTKIKKWVELLILLLWMGCCLCFFTQLYDDAVKIVNDLYIAYEASSDYVFQPLSPLNPLFYQEINTSVLFAFFMLFIPYMMVQYYFVIKWNQKLFSFLLSFIVYLPMLLYSLPQPWFLSGLLYVIWVSMFVSSNKLFRLKGTLSLIFYYGLCSAVIICAIITFYPMDQYKMDENVNLNRKKLLDAIEKVEDGLFKASEKQGEINLMNAQNRVYTYNEHLKIQTNMTEPFYLKGFVGSIYQDNKWVNLKYEDYENQTGIMWENIPYWLSGNANVVVNGQKQEYDTKFITVNDYRTIKKYELIPYYLRSMSAQDVDMISVKPYFDSYMNKSKADIIYYETWDIDRIPYFDTFHTRNYLHFIREYYLDVPENIKALFDRIFPSISEDAYQILQTDRQRIDYVKYNVIHYLNDAVSYTLTPGKTPKGEDFVEYFLWENRKGYCVHYASAATLLFRHYGIPARYVEGYKVDAKPFEGEFQNLSISDRHQHAWVEVFDREKGWVPIEVTFAQENKHPVFYLEEGYENNQENIVDSNTENNQNTYHPDTNVTLEIVHKDVAQESFDWRLLIYCLLGIILVLVMNLYHLKQFYRKLKRKKYNNNQKVQYDYRYYQRWKHYDEEMPDDIRNIFEKARFSQHSISDDEVCIVHQFIQDKMKYLRKNLKWYQKFKFYLWEA